MLVTQGVFATLVLCAGERDHFVMEMTHVPSTQHGERSPCVDVPMFVSAEKPSRIDWQLNPALDALQPLLISGTRPIQSEADTPLRRAWHRECSIYDPILSSLRTVLLLI